MASKNTEQLNPLPAGTPLADLLMHLRDTGRGMDFRLPLQELLALLGIGLTDWNAQKNPLKVVRTYADLLQLNPLSCCRGTKGVVLDDTPGYPAGDYVLLYTDHANAWNYVCQDGTFDQNPNNLTDAAWYPVDSPEAGVPAYSQLSPAYSAGPPLSGYAFAVDELVRAFVPGSTTEQFFAALTPAGPRPTPSNAGGDSFWRVVNRGDVPTPPPAITYRPLPTLQAQQLNAAGDQQSITYRILRGADANGRLGDVQVQGLAYSPALTPDEGDFPAQFASIVLWQDPLDGIWKSRRYDVVTDTVYPLDVTPPPFVLEDLDGRFTSYSLLHEALAASQEDFVLDINRNEAILLFDATFSGVINGRNRGFSATTGTTLTLVNAVIVNDLALVSGNTLLVVDTGTGTPCQFFHCRISRPMRVAAGATLLASDCALASPTVFGTLVLRAGSTTDAGYLATLTRNADGTYTTPNGGTVKDERGGSDGPVFDPYEVSLTIRQAVANGFDAQEAASNNSPFLSDPQPAGSLVGMEFIDPQEEYLYKYRPVAFANGTFNVWVSTLLSR